MAWSWQTNDPFKTCSFCGNAVKHGSGWITIGMCEEHERIWTEDIKSGFARNRLREIMIQRGEISETKAGFHCHEIPLKNANEIKL